MTRQEELVQAARKEYPEWEEAQCHFIDGAHYADSHPHWISVEDELPKEKGWIILSTFFNSMACPAYYYEGEDVEELRSQGITHWMPLPKMPILSNSSSAGKDLKGGEG